MATVATSCQLQRGKCWVKLEGTVDAGAEETKRWTLMASLMMAFSKNIQKASWYLFH
jgi:hypothetical protein